MHTNLSAIYNEKISQNLTHFFYNSNFFLADDLLHYYSADGRAIYLFFLFTALAGS